MKHKSLYIAAAMATAVAFHACDQVDEADRYLPWTPSTTGHCVLVEEFSGQLCVNCPAAAVELESLQEYYGADTVIVVSIHAGEGYNLAVSQDRAAALGTQGLATSFGEQLFASYGLTSEPNAVVDRSTGVIAQPQWTTSIVNALSTPTNLQLSLQPTYDADSRTLTVDVLAQSSVELEGNVNVWLTEDSIVAVQRLANGGWDFNHVFHNIFRASATPMEGQPVIIAYGEEPQLLHTATFAIDQLWRPEKLHVVAFVEGSHGVEQTTIAPICEQ